LVGKDSTSFGERGWEWGGEVERKGVERPIFGIVVGKTAREISLPWLV
jgi:hypothetical protein